MGNKFMLFLLVWFIIAGFVIVGAVEALSYAGIAERNALLQSPWLTIGIQVLGLLVPMFVWLSVKKQSFKANMPSMPLGGTNIVIIVLLGFFLQPAMMLISSISSLFFTNHVTEMMYGALEQPIWLILLAMAVTPAIVEELVFRGYLQAQHSNFPIKQAALLNGLFFGIIHLNPQQFSYAFVLGIIFAYMVYYTRSIWAGILPHFIFNASQGLLGRWAFNTAANPEPVYEAPITWALMESNPELAGVIVMAVITLFASPIIISLFVALVKHNKSRVEVPQIAQAEYQPPTCSEYCSASASNWPTSYVPPSTNAPNWTTPHVPPDNFTVEPPPRLFDKFTIAVIAIFIVFSYFHI